jgi:hypothetical protein
VQVIHNTWCSPRRVSVRWGSLAVEGKPVNLLIVSLLLLCQCMWAQSWSGIIAPSRAIDWSKVGIPGGLPDASWTQCGSTIAAYGSSGSPASTSTINNAITACSSQTYVLLGAGTFYLTGAIGGKDQVVVRGQGANSTFLVFYAEGSCWGEYSQLCMAGSGGYPGSVNTEDHIAQWTSGFSQGATSVTLTSQPFKPTAETWKGGSATLTLAAGNAAVLSPPSYVMTTGFLPSGWNVGCTQITGQGYGPTTIIFPIASNPGTVTQVGTYQQCGFSNITANSTLLTLDQQDAPVDTGNIWVCAQVSCGSFGSGGIRIDGTCATTVSPYVGFCTQQQQVLVTACSPTCSGATNSTTITLTISPGLRAPNWNNAAVTGSTGAFWPTTTAYQRGVENLSADLTNTSGGTNSVVIFNCYECWVSGIRSIDPGPQTHVWLFGSSRAIVQNNYFYEGASHQTQSYGATLYAGASDNLIVNNIFQQVTDSTPNNNSGGAGNVAGYNFTVMDIYYNGAGGWFQPSDYEHSGGQFYWLREGNDTLSLITDEVHGTHHFTTAFRNRYPGWQVAGCQVSSEDPANTPCVSNTTAMNFFAASRYFNVIGNVLGQANYHTNYTSLPSSGTQNSSVYYLGGNPGQGQVGALVSTSVGSTACVTCTYLVGDILKLVQSGGSGGQVTVSAVSSGTPTAVVPLYPYGSGYTAANGVATTGGSGSGATINLNFVGAPGAYCAQAACSSLTQTGDVLTANSLMRWGNWDDVTAGCGATLTCATTTVRWCGNSSSPGWSTTCGSTSEIPTAFGDTTGTTSTYVNPVPSSTTLPASFIYPSKPSWWGNLPWPATGPDVTGGNMGICSGGTYANSYVTSSSQCTGGGTMVAAFGGHANANPAMNCYLNVMGGPPDGTGNVLLFDANSCYGSAGSTGPAAQPTAVTVTVQ